MILVLDENLSGRSILDPLRQANIPVKALTEVMPRGTPDEELLVHIAKHPDHFLLSKDSDFYRHSGIRDTLKYHGVGAFVLANHKNQTGSQLADQIIKAWPKIQVLADSTPLPFVFKLVQNRIEKVV